MPFVVLVSGLVWKGKEMDWGLFWIHLVGSAHELHNWSEQFCAHSMVPELRLFYSRTALPRQEAHPCRLSMPCHGSISGFYRTPGSNPAGADFFFFFFSFCGSPQPDLFLSRLVSVFGRLVHYRQNPGDFAPFAPVRSFCTIFAGQRLASFSERMRMTFFF